MKITVTGQQIGVGEALRSYVTRRIVGSVTKYFDNAINAHVVFSHEGSQFRTDVRVHVGKGMEWESHAEKTDIHTSFNAAVAHLEKQLRRHKGQMRDHHRDQHNAAESSGFVGED